MRSGVPVDRPAITHYEVLLISRELLVLVCYARTALAAHIHSAPAWLFMR